MALKDHGIIEDLKPLGGGWRYVQDVRGTLHTIPASFDPIKKTNGAIKGRVLVEMVRQFRINMGLPEGTPDQDIADFIKRISPPNDRFRTTHGVSIPRTHAIRPLAQDLREWVDAVAPERPMLLTEPEATERAQACLKCPQNIKWKTGCGECNTEIEYRGALLRNRANYGYDELLRGCRLHKVLLSAAVFLDRDNLPARDPQAPAECWMPIPTP